MADRESGAAAEAKRLRLALEAVRAELQRVDAAPARVATALSVIHIALAPYAVPAATSLPPVCPHCKREPGQPCGDLRHGLCWLTGTACAATAALLPAPGVPFKATLLFDDETRVVDGVIPADALGVPVLPRGYEVWATDCRPSEAPGAWTCKACGFRGFWRGVHCGPSGVPAPGGQTKPS